MTNLFMSLIKGGQDEIRPVEKDDVLSRIVTITEAAERLDTSLSQLYLLKRKHPGFPKPVNKVNARGAIYDLKDLKAFLDYYDATKRRRGRPSKSNVAYDKVA